MSGNFGRYVSQLITFIEWARYYFIGCLPANKPLGILLFFRSVFNAVLRNYRQGNINTFGRGTTILARLERFTLVPKTC